MNTASLDFLDGVPERHECFRRLFEVTARLGDLINAFLEQHDEIMDFRRDDAARFLGMMVATSFGKALKTFQAIERLCLFGYGEDALVLVRANLNLLINLTHILSAPDPTERVKDFIAYSYSERVRAVRDGYGETLNWEPDGISDEEVRQRTAEWKKLGIADRAKGAPPLHYLRGYKAYSSMEHSDALALDNFVTVHDDGSLHIEAGERDEHVGLALAHSWSVMTEVFVTVCRHFKIQIPEIERELQETWNHLEV